MLSQGMGFNCMSTRATPKMLPVRFPFGFPYQAEKATLQHRHTCAQTQAQTQTQTHTSTNSDTHTHINTRTHTNTNTNTNMYLLFLYLSTSPRFSPNSSLCLLCWHRCARRGATARNPHFGESGGTLKWMFDVCVSTIFPGWLVGQCRCLCVCGFCGYHFLLVSQ